MKIIHLLPKDGLGGAEQAARSLKPDSKLNIRLAFSCGESLLESDHIDLINPKVKLNSVMFYASSFSYLIREQPDILISSLWRSNLLSVIYYYYNKLIYRKKIKLIVFMHSSGFRSIFNKFISIHALQIANEVWCDSYSTKAFVLSLNKKIKHIEVISFFTPIPSNYKKKKNVKKKNDFIYWGRITRVKRIDRTIRLFNEIKKREATSRLFIYGPDGGDLVNLKKLVVELGLSDTVSFMGEKEPNTYPEEALYSKFFIQTSSIEGMGIAVTEAMQLGLVPIVTPVGEISDYCTNGVNSIYYDDSTLDMIMKAMYDNEYYQQLSQNASDYWNLKKDYSIDFNNNCLRLVNI